MLRVAPASVFLCALLLGTTRPGSPLRQSRKQRGHVGRSNTERGVGGSVGSSNLDRASVVAQEQWCPSGFANTDLDVLLQRHGIHQLITMGLIAHTCLKATVRYGAEQSDEEMHAALEVNIPDYATAVISAGEAIEAIPP